MKTLFSLFFLSIFSSVNADNQTFSGNMIVTPGSTETYTITWESWNSVYENNSIVSWFVSNGTVLSSSKSQVTIEWDLVPEWMNSTGTIEVYEDLGGQIGTCNVQLRNFEEGIIEECSNILGPPAALINFGQGNAIGPALSAGTTTYSYQSFCNITFGNYTIVNSTTGCNGSWLNLPQDHTPGDVNGYMMLVDGDKTSQEVYRKSVTGLTQAFKYEFSAYLANLSNPIGTNFQEPRVQFELYDLSNNLIKKSGSYTIGYNSVNPWQKISFLFDIPNGMNSVQIVIRNVNNSSRGNDFVIEDLSFAPCYPPIIASFSATSIITKSYNCNTGSVNLFYQWPTPTIPFANPRFKWQRSINSSSWSDIPGATFQNYPLTQTLPGLYKYRVIAFELSNPSLQSISNEIIFFVQKMVVDTKTYSTFNCISQPFVLNPDYRLLYSDADAQSSFTFSWSPGTFLNNPLIEKPTITLPPLPSPPAINATNPAPPILRAYNLTVNNTAYSGCFASAVQTIAQYNPRKVAIPSAFTPTSSTNNLFRPINIQDYPGSEFWIRDRWGNLVFYSQGPTLPDYSWNGKIGGQYAEQGNYTWRVDIKGAGCANNILNSAGSNVTNNPYGNVLLIR